MNNQQKIKSFFERPEGNTGLVFIGLFITFMMVLGWWFLPMIIIILQNTIYAGLLAVLIFVVVSLLINDNFRFICSSAFKSTMRMITGAFIAIDPIGILKNYIADMEEKIGQIEKNIKSLSSVISQVSADIAARKNRAENALRLAKAAEERGQVDMFRLQASMAGREKNSIEKLDTLVKKMDLLYKILDKMKRNVEFLLLDTKHEVQVREAEYKSVRAAHKAMSGAQALIAGDKAKEMFDQAMEYIAADIGEKLGEMQRFMDVSADFMNNMDLQNAVFNEEGLELLASWEQNGSLIMDYDKKRTITAVNGATVNVKALPEGSRVPLIDNQDSSIADLFNSSKK